MTEAPEDYGGDNSPAAVVRRYLTLIVDDPISDRQLGPAVDLLGDLYQALDQRPADCFHALAEHLKSTDRGRRIIAATLLVVLVHEGTLVPYYADGEAPATIVIDCLRSGGPEEQLRALAILGQHSFPKDIVGPLTRLLHRRGSDLSICASLALRRCSPELIMTESEAEIATGTGLPARRIEVQDVQEALRLGMEQGVPQILRSNCAAAILETEPVASPPYAAATAVLNAVESQFLFAPLMGIYKSGRVGAEALVRLDALLRDARLPIQLRVAVAGAIGSSCRDRPDVIRSVARLGQYERRDVLLSMCAGLQQRPIANNEVIDILVGLLRSSDRTVRLHATWALGSARPLPESALTAVVELARRDDEIDLAPAVAQVLVAAGTEAAPVFRKFMEAGVPRLTAIVNLVINAMDTDHVRHWLAAYEAEYDWVVDAVLRAAFDKMGKEAASLAADLCKHLNGTMDEAKRDTYLYCISRTTANDGIAVRAVARQLCDRSDDIVLLAEAVLMDMGSAALAPLEEMRVGADPLQRTRIEKVLTRLAQPKQMSRSSESVGGESEDVDPMYSKICEELSDDHLLRTFVKTVDVMRRLNGKASFGDVAEELHAMKEAKRIPKELAPSKTMLWKRMKELENLVGRRLFTNSSNRKGGPTEDAKRLYRAAIVHLQHR